MRSFYVYLLLLLAQAGAAQTLRPYRQGKLWGYRTPAGRVVIASRYQRAAAFRGGLAKVWRAKKCGYVNAQGREVIPVRWDAASYLEDSALGLDQSLLSWPEACQWVLVMERNWAPANEGGFAQQENTEQFGFYTKQGQVVLPARYLYFRRLSPDYFEAAYIADYESGEEAGGDQITSYYHRPLLGMQLLHRSGRLLAPKHYFTHIAGVYGAKVVVNREGFIPAPYAHNATDPAELRDTTGQVLLAYTAKPNLVAFSSLEPLGGGTDLWLATSYSNPDSTYLLHADGRPVLTTGFRYAWLLDSQHVVVNVPQLRGGMLGGILALATGNWLMRAPFFITGPGVGTALLTWQDQQRGAIQADGCPLIPNRYDKLAPCRTHGGRPLPFWYAQRGDQAWLLGPTGQELLDLQGPRLVGWQFDEDLSLTDEEWSDTQQATVRLDTTGRQPAATLTLRPRPAP